MSRPINKSGQDVGANKVICLLRKRCQKWKEKAKVRQKKSRALSWRVRDLSRSRCEWRQRALRAESRLPVGEPQGGVVANQEGGARAKGYGYDTWQVVVSVLWYLYAGVGFRGVAKCWAVLGGKVPHPCTVRQWVLRTGYHRLLQEVERADDWVYIADYTAQMGNEQCLAILGCRLGVLRSQECYTLNHQDMTLLDLSIVQWANGEHLAARLAAVAARSGPPCQIVTDCCSTMKKGVRLWQEKSGQSATVHTYDISHVTATRLEKLLEHDPQWSTLVSAVNTLQKNIVQTSMSFLAPPSLRKKARYMNLAPLLSWCGKILAYAQKNDFRLCSTTGDESSKKTQFYQHFAPLLAMRPFLLALQQLLELLQCLMDEFKNNGLSRSSFQKWEGLPWELLEDLNRDFLVEWMADMRKQVDALHDEQVYVATSDIVESLFAHYKNTGQTHWLKGMSPTILMMSAFCGTIDQPQIHSALENSPPMKTIDQWFYDQRKEPSFLAKRRQALKSKPKPKRTKTVGTNSA